MSPGPTPPPRRSMPAGYLLLGMVLVVMSFGFAMGVVDADGGVLVRAGFGIVALASAHVRPWVGRAVDAWAAACCAAVLIPGLGAVVSGGVAAAIVVFTAIALCFVAVPCGAVRWYVRDRARRLGLAPGLVP